MQNITSIADLKSAIQTLESEQLLKKQLLRKQFFITYAEMKPAKLLESTLKDLTSSSYLMEDPISKAAGLITGFLTKKIIVGSSDNIFRKLLGSAVQMGVTHIVSKNPFIIKATGQLITKFFLNKKAKNP